MERLTRHIGSRAATIPDMGDLQNLRAVVDRLAAYEDIGIEPSETPTGLELARIFAALQELKRYKDAEEQGLLVRLPCKVADTLYIIAVDPHVPSTSEIFPVSIDRVAISRENGLEVNVTVRDFMGRARWKQIITAYQFGKTVFLTRKAAEATLAKMTDSGRGDREMGDRH